MRQNYIFNPVGSVFAEGELTLRVVLSKDGGKTCSGCWYNSRHSEGGKSRNIRNYKNACYMHRHCCTASTRQDGKQVVFKLVD